MSPKTITLASVAAAALLAWARPAAACGPWFPVDLLSHRDDTMSELEEGVFATEAARLVARPATPYRVVSSDDRWLRSGGGERERALYDRGAQAFEAGDYAAAERAFERLLALPADQRRHRSTWAAYMLGRIRAGADAIAAYQKVRALVADGYEDALGLAASSLGQEARFHLERGETAAAIELYAEQAAIGHPDGATSLLEVVRDRVHHEGEGALLASPLGQRLVAIYLHSRAYELTRDEADRAWRALAATDGVAGAGHLAAAAYRAGRWDLAARFAAAEPDAIESEWVRAKLALRDGDRAAAARFLDRASARCTAAAAGDDSDAGDPVRDRIDGERAILALRADRPVDAMTAMWPARHSYPLDVARIAERVLTTDELRAFVDRLPEVARWNEPVPIRDLLARRLMREGRYLEALPYTDAEPRTDAAVFASAMSRTGTGDDFARAHALYEASRIARRHGMEILGTEHAPDWAAFDGGYDLTEYGYDGGWPSDEPSPWVTDGERRRIDRSSPAIDRRYHYRYLASYLAERAADHLPPRSQAFAAVLCHATRYIMNIDEDRRDHLYGRYVAEGATVDFASTFGQECPEPEFERARAMFPPPEPQLGWVAVAWPGGLGLLMLLGRLGLAWRRRRRRAL